LLSFHPEVALTSGDQKLTVFPSNSSLSNRAHGMAKATLKRQISSLVESGLIVRRDSPNGKRYVRKGDDGGVESAFGFDLSPLISRAAEFSALRKAVHDERRVILLRKEEITLARRDIAKALDLARREVPKAPATQSQYRADILVAGITKAKSADAVTDLAAQMGSLSREIAMSLINHINSNIMSPNEAQNEPHIWSAPL
jgi:replication initiation protein RepC